MVASIVGRIIRNLLMLLSLVQHIIAVPRVQQSYDSQTVGNRRINADVDANIIIYTKNNFRGRPFKITGLKHIGDCKNLEDTTQRPMVKINDNIRSIKLGANVCVRLYENDCEMEEMGKILDTNSKSPWTSKLENIGFGGITSAIELIECPKLESLTITLYSEINYQGDRIELHGLQEIGDCEEFENSDGYNVMISEDLRQFNKRAKSIKLEDGVCVRLNKNQCDNIVESLDATKTSSWTTNLVKARYGNAVLSVERIDCPVMGRVTPKTNLNNFPTGEPEETFNHVTTRLSSVPFQVLGSNSDLSLILRTIKNALLVEDVASIQTIFQYFVGLENGKTFSFYADLKTYPGKIDVGTSPKPPDVTIRASELDITNLYKGELDGVSAYLSGKIKIEGSPRKARAFENIIKRILENEHTFSLDPNSELFQIFNNVKNTPVENSAVSNTQAIFQYNIKLENGKNFSFYADLKNYPGKIDSGKTPNHPDVTIMTSESNFVKLYKGELDGSSAYLDGDLEIDGSLFKAKALEDLLTRVRKRQGRNPNVEQNQGKTKPDESSRSILDPNSELSKIVIKLKNAQVTDEAVEEIQAVFQYVIELENGKTFSFYADLKNYPGKIDIGKTPEDPDVTLKASESNFVKLYKGELNGVEAYLSGDLEIDGSPIKAKALEDLLKRVRENKIDEKVKSEEEIIREPVDYEDIQPTTTKRPESTRRLVVTHPSTTRRTTMTQRRTTTSPSTAVLDSNSELYDIITKVRNTPVENIVVDKVKTLFQYIINLDNGKDFLFYADLKNSPGKVDVGKARHDADVTLTVSEANFVKLYKGELDGIQAFLSGALKIDGDPLKAKALNDLMKTARQNGVQTNTSEEQVTSDEYKSEETPPTTTTRRPPLSRRTSPTKPTTTTRTRSTGREIINRRRTTTPSASDLDSNSELANVITKITTTPVGNEVVDKVKTIFQYVIKQDNGQNFLFYADLKNSPGKVDIGRTPHRADVTLTVSEDDFVKLYKGELDGIQAFLSGALKIDGDPLKAKALNDLMKAARENAVVETNTSEEQVKSEEYKYEETQRTTTRRPPITRRSTTTRQAAVTQQQTKATSLTGSSLDPNSELSDVINKITSTPVGNDVVDKVKTIFQYVIKLENGEEFYFYADLKNSPPKVDVGKSRHLADVTLTASEDNFVKLYKGELDGIQAFLTGVLKIDGDPLKAKALNDLMKAARENGVSEPSINKVQVRKEEESQNTITPTMTQNPTLIRPSAGSSIPGLGSNSELSKIISDVTNTPVEDDAVKSVKTIFEYRIKLGNGKQFFFYADLKNIPGKVGVGKSPQRADVILTVSEADFLKLYNGQLGGTTAYLTGALKIEGDVFKAKALEELMAKVRQKQMKNQNGSNAGQTETLPSIASNFNLNNVLNLVNSPVAKDAIDKGMSVYNLVNTFADRKRWALWSNDEESSEEDYE